MIVSIIFESLEVNLSMVFLLLLSGSVLLFHLMKGGVYIIKAVLKLISTAFYGKAYLNHCKAVDNLIKNTPSKVLHS